MKEIASNQTAPLKVEKVPQLDHLQQAIDHAAHLLPAQGPITVFIHHNTLHAFEDLPFLEAVKKGGRVFGCHPFLPEDRYRDTGGNCFWPRWNAKSAA